MSILHTELNWNILPQDNVGAENIHVQKNLSRVIKKKDLNIA